jgi:plastocyanin
VVLIALFGVWATAALADGTVQMTEPSATDINSWAFTPPDITIAAGQNVTWMNAGTQAHTATSTSGAFDTGLVQPGESQTITLDSAGSYAYQCTPHPWMKGTVTVLAAAAAPPAAQPAAPAPAPAAQPGAPPAAAQAPTPTPFRFLTPTPVVARPATGATTTTAPRAGGIPLELVAPLLAASASALGGGALLLRRRNK